MGDIVSVIFKAPVHIMTEKKKEPTNEKSNNNPDDSKPDSKKQKKRTTAELEIDEEIFNNYMHCFFDQCARELGNRDFDEYRAMNAEEGKNYDNIPDWHTEPCLEPYKEKDLLAKMNYSSQ